MLASSIEAAGSIIARWLALHEQRRHIGLPTVSVLAGPLGLGISCLRDWALHDHRLLAVFEPDHQGFEAVVKAWIDRLVADRDLFDEAKAVAVALASRLAEESGRAIGEHYGIGSSAIGAIHRRLADRRDALDVVESLAGQLRRKRTKYKA